MDQSEEVCFICLQGPEYSPLTHPCKCPRPSHPKCLSRWQLAQAGRSEESRCRFCHSVLPDWKPTLTPSNVQPVAPVMAIKYEGRTYKLRVQPGPAGLLEFQAQVQALLGFSITEDYDVTFECSVPQTGEKMKLNGLASYGAATHCAAITAAQREPRAAHHRYRSRHRHGVTGSGVSARSLDLPTTGSTLTSSTSASSSSSPTPSLVSPGPAFTCSASQVLHSGAGGTAVASTGSVVLAGAPGGTSAAAATTQTGSTPRPQPSGQPTPSRPQSPRAAAVAASMGLLHGLVSGCVASSMSRSISPSAAEADADSAAAPSSSNACGRRGSVRVALALHEAAAGGSGLSYRRGSGLRRVRSQSFSVLQTSQTVTESGYISVAGADMGSASAAVGSRQTALRLLRETSNATDESEPLHGHAIAIAGGSTGTCREVKPSNAVTIALPTDGCHNSSLGDGESSSSSNLFSGKLSAMSKKASQRISKMMQHIGL